MLDTLITEAVTPIGTDPAAGATRTGRPTMDPRAVTTPEQTLLLVADPDPILLHTLSTALLDRGINRVIRIGLVDGVHGALAGMVGDLALIGLGFGDPAIRLITELRAAGWPRVIALAPTTHPGPLLDAVRAGATGVLRCPPATPIQHPDPRAAPALSPREVEILRLVADGRSNNSIGERLSLSSLSVKKQLARIARKFGYSAREQLVAAALREGIID